MTDNNKIISETFRKDGTLATRVIREGASLWLFQYDREGQVTFAQELDKNNFNPTDITYHDGCVATITRREGVSIFATRTISQYDESGHIITNIELNQDDIVNFGQSGYIRSVVKHIGPMFGVNTEREEIQFNDNGYILSSTHKVKIDILASAGEEKWVTTDAKQYYPDGKLLTHITYAQKTKRRGNYKTTNEEDKATSYISSVTQYNEAGKLQISAQLHEHDEVSFNGEKVACIIRRVMKSDGSLETTSVTTYYASGNICTVTAYKDDKVISSVTYDENGKPQSSAQQGDEEYQDIFKNVNKKQSFVKAMSKASAMPVQQAAQILGVSLNVSEAELKKAYRRLSMKWHPDHNVGNEEQANRMMKQINEAYQVMCEYLRAHHHENPGHDTKPDNDGHKNNQNNNNQEAVKQAWQNLQQAIKAYEDAEAAFNQARSYAEETEKLMNEAHERWRKHFSDTSAQKFYDQARARHEKAAQAAEEAWRRMALAQLDMHARKSEYQNLVNANKAQFTSKCYSYQRAA